MIDVKYKREMFMS